jgi:CHASE3 domain sensor protein
MVLASGLLALIVGGAFAALLVALDNEAEASDRSRHAQLVLSAASDLERLVVDLETGERGFVITGDEGFLEPWTAAQASLPAATSELERLARGPVQHARAERITAQIDSYLRDYSVPVVAAARRGDRPPSASRRRWTGGGESTRCAPTSISSGSPSATSPPVSRTGSMPPPGAPSSRR